MFYIQCFMFNVLSVMLDGKPFAWVYKSIHLFLYCHQSWLLAFMSIY